VNFFRLTVPQALFGLLEPITVASEVKDDETMNYKTPVELALNDQGISENPGQHNDIELQPNGVEPAPHPPIHLSSTVDEGIGISTPPSKHDTKDIDIPTELYKCSVHLSLLQTIKEILTATVSAITSTTPDSVSILTVIPQDISREWVQLLLMSAQFAHRFNLDEPIRYHLWTSGHVTQLPHLIRQETVAYSIYLQVGFTVYRMYGDNYALSDTPFIVGLLRESVDILSRFITLITNTAPPAKPREITNWSSLVIAILHELTITISLTQPTPSSISYQSLNSNLLEFYSLAITVIISDRVPIRQSVSKFLESLKPFLSFALACPSHH